MSNTNSSIKVIGDALQDKYKGVMILPACITVESSKGSIVIYKLRTWFTICQGDKRLECDPSEVVDEVAKLM